MNTGCGNQVGNLPCLRPFSLAKESNMTDNKKKGDFNKGGKDDVGGDKKQRNTSGQNSGSGGRD